MCTYLVPRPVPGEGLLAVTEGVLEPAVRVNSLPNFDPIAA